MYEIILGIVGTAIVGQAITGLKWAANANRRLSTIEDRMIEREKQLLERHEAVLDRLERIEWKVDDRNGRH